MTIELTLFFCKQRLGSPQFERLKFADSELAEAQRTAAFHVGAQPFCGGSGLSDLYAYNLATANSLRAKGVTAAQLFPQLQAPSIIPDTSVSDAMVAAFQTPE